MNLTIVAIKYLRAMVAHGERGEHKPRNGDRIHTIIYTKRNSKKPPTKLKAADP